MRVHNWGKPLAVLALVFGIISIVFTMLSFFALIIGGVALSYLALVFGGFAVSFGVPGVIGSYSKGVGIVGLVFGGVSVFLVILRLAAVLSAFTV